MACINLDGIGNAEYLQQLGQKARDAGIPLSAGIELTERCNLRCIHCYLGDQEPLRAERSRELNTGQWIDILDQIAEIGCLTLLITGGDPLLRKDFGEIYAYAKRKGLLVTIFTNGTLLTDAILDLFRELPPTCCEISLYGATRATYEAITDTPGSYDRCIAAIERLEGLGVDLRLKTVLMQPNQHEFRQIAEYGRLHSYAGKFRFSHAIMGSFDGGKGPLDLRLEPEEAVDIEMSQKGRIEKWQDYYDGRLSQQPAHPERLYSCGAADGGFHIDAYGCLQPCLSAKHITYNLANGSLRTGLQAIRSRLWARRLPPDSACGQCSERMVCHSCPAIALLEDGQEQFRNEYHCRVTRARSELISAARRNEG